MPGQGRGDSREMRGEHNSAEAPAAESESEATRGAPGDTGRWWLVAALVVMYALLAGAPFIRGIPAAVGSIGVTVLFILAAMSGAAGLAAISMSWLGELLGMLACLGVWYVVAGIAESSDLGRALAVPAADVFFLVACVLAGRLLARILRDRNLLLPVCVVLALADVFTVFLGPTRLALEEMPELVSKLSIKLPRVGSAAGPEGVGGLVHLATMGPGDLVFLSFFFVAAVRFGLSVRATFAGIFALVAVGLAIIVALPRAIAVPVLPLMAVGFLIANHGEFKLTRAEKRNLIVAAALFAAIILAMWGLTRLAQ